MFTSMDWVTAGADERQNYFGGKRVVSRNLLPHPHSRVKNCSGGKMTLLDDVHMTTLMRFITEGLLPQPQKDHCGVEALTAQVT